MSLRILWIEDDHYAIKGLVRPLEKKGVQIEVASSAESGFQKAKVWNEYDMIIVDLIMPLSDHPGKIPPEIEGWGLEPYVGLGILKWLFHEVKAKCPIVVLSVIDDPLVGYGIDDSLLAGRWVKRGLLPSKVEQEVTRLLQDAA